MAPDQAIGQPDPTTDKSDMVLGHQHSASWLSHTTVSFLDSSFFPEIALCRKIPQDPLAVTTAYTERHHVCFSGP